ARCRGHAHAGDGGRGVLVERDSRGGGRNRRGVGDRVDGDGDGGVVGHPADNRRAVLRGRRHVERVGAFELAVGGVAQAGQDRVDVARQAGNRDRVGAVGANRGGEIEAAVNRQRAVGHLQRDGDGIARVARCRGHAHAGDGGRGVLVERDSRGGGRNRRGVGDRVDGDGDGGVVGHPADNRRAVLRGRRHVERVG